jgi:hypothetical protein
MQDAGCRKGVEDGRDTGCTEALWHLGSMEICISSYLWSETPI